MIIGGFNKPKDIDNIRFICISDTDWNEECFDKIIDGDVLVHGGDFSHVDTE